MRLRKIITRTVSCWHSEDAAGDIEVTGRWKEASTGQEYSASIELPYMQAANAMMSAKGYVAYVKKHGYHFTDSLAEHVSRLMVNAGGQQHTWAVAQVVKAIGGMGLALPKNVTPGDVAYLANMYYADLYPEPLKDEASCLKAAYRAACDPDGYEGMVFLRWTADAVGKTLKIDWDKFI